MLLQWPGHMQDVPSLARVLLSAGLFVHMTGTCVLCPCNRGGAGHDPNDHAAARSAPSACVSLARHTHSCVKYLLDAWRYAPRRSWMRAWRPCSGTAAHARRGASSAPGARTSPARRACPSARAPAKRWARAQGVPSRGARDPPAQCQGLRKQPSQRRQAPKALVPSLAS